MATNEQDFVLSEYILDCRDEGRGVQSCRDCIAALQMMWPSTKFRVASRIVNGWASLVPPCRAPPIDRAAAMALCTLMVAAGEAWAACVCMLCFTALLRISEALTLRSCDLVVTAQYHVIVMLRRTKTG